MRRQIIILSALLFAAPVSAQIIHRPPPSIYCQLWDVCRVPPRVAPYDPRPYVMPRSVGAWSQYNDMSLAPLPWWSISTGRPFWETLEKMRDDHGLTAVGFALRAHPTENVFENIRKAFRIDGIDIIVLWVTRWASTEPHFDGGESVVWQDYPLTLFEDLYKTYGQQEKVIILMTYESDNRLHGKGCQDRDKCVPWGWYWNDCPAVCEEMRAYDDTWPVDHGWWFPEGYVSPNDCRSICCDMNKSVRRNYMLKTFNERQAAAAEARANHPDAKLRVFFAVELDRYGRHDDWLTTGRDIVPFMDSLEGLMIGVSCWPEKCGGTSEEVVESFNQVRTWTGLPAYRIFIAEVGAKEKYIGRQYDRLMTVVKPLFDLGSPFALVWSLEQSSEGQITTHALVDPATGEYRSGMQAIVELNEMYKGD